MRSPLNEGHNKKTDSIAAANAWKEFKKGYMDRTNKTPEENEKEYNMEKNEFYYDTTRGKLRLIPTDDGEVQDRSGIESWQLAPSMKTPIKKEKKQDPREAKQQALLKEAKKQRKRLHAVSSITDKAIKEQDYPGQVGVDLGIIKKKSALN